MKKNVLLSLLVLYVFSGFSADSTIVFRQLSYLETVQAAKNESKLVFLYFHFDGCGACVKMERTAFKTPAVYEYMNQHFVTLEVNTLKGEGIEINKIFNVRMHPTFMLLDQEGSILHKWVGVFTPEEFLVQVEQAVDGTSHYTKSMKRYREGDRDPDFLYTHCYVLRDASELSIPVIREYLATQSVAQLQEDRNIRFIGEFAVHGFETGVPFNSDAYKLMFDRRDLFSPFLEPEQVDTRLLWIANHEASDAIENLDSVRFHNALAVLRTFPEKEHWPYKEIDGRMTGVVFGKNLIETIQSMYDYKSGNLVAYRRSNDAYVKANWHDAIALNEKAWNVYETIEDPQTIRNAIDWSKRSIRLSRKYVYTDTYAALLFKNGMYKKALKQADKAISLAQKEGSRYEETALLKEKISEAMHRQKGPQTIKL